MASQRVRFRVRAVVPDMGSSRGRGRRGGHLECRSRGWIGAGDRMGVSWVIPMKFLAVRRQVRPASQLLSDHPIPVVRSVASAPPFAQCLVRVLSLLSHRVSTAVVALSRAVVDSASAQGGSAAARPCNAMRPTGPRTKWGRHGPGGFGPCRLRRERVSPRERVNSRVPPAGLEPGWRRPPWRWSRCSGPRREVPWSGRGAHHRARPHVRRRHQPHRRHQPRH
jgi:hypothetical protein